MTPRAKTSRQLRLPLSRAPSFARAEFIVSPASAQALAALDVWREWAGGQLALVGPPGSGKTHLARAWALASGAEILTGAPIETAGLAGRAVVLEDVDRRGADEALFHLINWAQAGGTLLLTARIAPRIWPTDLPDLRSRLNAMLVAELSPPDDAVLEGVMRKFFRERNIRPEADVLPYLIRRIPRSVPAAMAAVELIDEAAASQGKEVNRALAREVLEGGAQTLDLFE